MVRPELVSESPADEVALNTWAQPNTPSLGLKSAPPPPNTTIASPAGNMLPAAKVKPVVSRLPGVARVGMFAPLTLLPSLAAALNASPHSSHRPSPTPQQ